MFINSILNLKGFNEEWKSSIQNRMSDLLFLLSDIRSQRCIFLIAGFFFFCCIVESFSVTELGEIPRKDKK